MDFQLARHLSALTRAQEEITKALLHIDSLADCLNREIIMAAASSEATEQLVTAAKTSLYQIQAILAAQSEEGVDFVVRKFHSSQLGVNALQVLLHPMCLSQTVKDQQLSRRIKSLQRSKFRLPRSRRNTGQRSANMKPLAEHQMPRLPL